MSKSILEMDKKELLILRAESVSHQLTANEVIHIATALGAFWKYDYAAARQGQVGKHALLKSGFHSDGFFVSKILLEPENIRHIMSYQIVIKLGIENVVVPDYVAGIPYGATALGSNVAKIIGVYEAYMSKINDRIVLDTKIPSGATLLLVEDFCTRGTGFREAVLQIKNTQPFVKILLYNPVIINRGGLKEIFVEGAGNFSVIPVVEQRIKGWNPIERCPLCDIGSVAIKPKITDENWRLLTTSQLK